MTKASAPQDFWRRVDQSGGVRACWPWLGSLHKKPDGYGQLGFQGRLWKAHRLAYALTFGCIPEGQLVCHSCDNKICCNPAHHFLGDHKANASDMMKKGRWGGPVGQKHPQAKLTSKIAEQIRQSPLTCRAAGKIFGISNVRVSQIRRGKGWKK